MWYLCWWIRLNKLNHHTFSTFFSSSFVYVVVCTVFIARFLLLCIVQPRCWKVHLDFTCRRQFAENETRANDITTYRRMGTSFHAIALKSRISDFSKSGLRSRERLGEGDNANEGGNSWNRSKIGLRRW